MEDRAGKLEVVARIARAIVRAARIAHIACIACVAGALALAASPEGAGQGGTASGHLTVDGKTVTLAHAYASAQPAFFDKNGEDIHVLLSDVPLADETRADVFALTKLARAGQAHIVEVIINAAGTPIGGAIYAKAFNGMVSVAGMHEFTKERLEAKIVAGRLSMDGPRTFMNVTYQYDAKFSAAIPRPPTAEEVAAALATPAAKAASAYVAALRQGQLAAFIATLDPAAAADYRGADAAARFKQLQADFPPDARVVGLTPQQDGTALAVVEGHQDGVVISYTLKMVSVGGAWKVGK